MNAGELERNVGIKYEYECREFEWCRYQAQELKCYTNIKYESYTTI